MNKTIGWMLGAIVLIGVLGTLGYAWLTPPNSPSPSWQKGHSVRSTDSGLWRLEWGYEDDEVRFLAFVHGITTKPDELVNVEGTLPNAQAQLCIPGQEPTPLPSEFNVFELIDGQLAQQNISLTVDQAKKFCDTENGQYTIAGLKEFLERQ